VSKTSSTTTRAPESFAIGQPIIAEEMREIARAANWAFTERPECHLSVGCGTAGWDGTFPGAIQTLAYTLADGVPITFLETDIWSPADGVGDVWTFGAEMFCGAGDVGQVTASLVGALGTESSATTHTAAQNGVEQTTTLNPANATAGGFEWLKFSVVVRLTTVAAAASEIRALRLEESVRSTIPDPIDV